MVTARTAATLAFVGVLAIAGTGCVNISAGEIGAVDTVEKRFSVSGAPQLSLSTFDGRIEVTTWNRPEVVVVIEKHAVDKEEADRMVVNAEQNGDAITVDVRQKDGWSHMHFGPRGAYLKVTVPEKARIDAQTGDGRITMDGVDGDLRAHTGDGSIHLTRVNGAVDAKSGDGSIEVDGTIRKLEVHSGDGRVHVRAQGSGPSSEWSMSTGDGSVVLEVPDGFGAELDASTGDGRVRVSDVAFSGSTDSRHRRSAQGRIGQGGPRITIHSGDGSISVRRSGESASRSTW